MFGAQCGQIGVAYIVGGVLVGRGILPHVRHSKRRSASSKVVGGGGETKAGGVEAGTVSV